MSKKNPNRKEVSPKIKVTCAQNDLNAFEQNRNFLLKYGKMTIGELGELSNNMTKAQALATAADFAEMSRLIRAKHGSAIDWKVCVSCVLGRN